MTKAPGRSVVVGLYLYRLLARAFPQDFKNAYGAELLEVAEDAIKPIWLRHGLLGLAMLFADIAIRVPAEHLAEMRRDLRYALRVLAAAPGSTAVTLLSLALGICIATCVLSEMNGMVLRTLPRVSAPSELVALEVPTSYPHYQRYHRLVDLFSSTAAYVAPVPFGLSFDGQSMRTWGHLVTPSYFSTLGVQPALGRLFASESEQRGQAPTAVISYRFWQQQLGADPLIIGKTLPINGRLSTIIGVGPKDFLGASPFLYVADLWMPIEAAERVAPELANSALQRSNLMIFHVVGRLKPGITAKRAEAELDAVTWQLERDNGVANKEHEEHITLVAGGKLLPLGKRDVPFFASFLLTMAALVLLIACANVANIMLARAMSRRKEIAMRLALGASRLRIVRQLLMESMVVAIGAGLLGFVTSFWLMHLASRITMPFPMPVSYDFRPDGRVLLFSLATTFLAGLGFGLAPALQATRADLNPALKEGDVVLFPRFRRLSLRNLLMVSQLAGSLMLLVVLGLLSLGIQSTMGIQAGFNPKNLYLISLDPIREGYSSEQTGAFFETVLDRVKKLPFVISATLTETVPVSLGTGWVIFSLPGKNGKQPITDNAMKYVVGHGYFDTTSIPILLGRGFRREDELSEGTAVIISGEFARRFFQGQDLLGRKLEIANDDEVVPPKVLPGSIDNRPGLTGRRVYQVVGVAGDVATELVMQRAHPAVYFPLSPTNYAEPSLDGITLMVRARPGVDVLTAVRRELRTFDEHVSPFHARSMTEQIAQFMSSLRIARWTYAIIGVFGLLLASIGLAGVTAYTVTQRAREIGIRMVLGARARNVLGSIMKEGLAVIAAGSLLGMAGAWAASWMLSIANAAVGTVTSTSTSDPVVLLGAPLLLGGVALVACFIPARKSMTTDPAIVLRQQ